MAQSVLVIADSGTGKSTAIRDLNPDETFIINIANKPLPFKGWKSSYKQINKENPKGNLTITSTAQGIVKAMKHVNDKLGHIKTIIVDDWQYMSSFEYFDRAHEKGYDKFTQIASNLAMVAKLPKDLRDDLTVITIGKMIDNTLTLEGLFSIVLFGKVNKNDDGELSYGFETQNNGENTCKSPQGMFEDLFIPNNLQYVKDCMKKYEE